MRIRRPRFTVQSLMLCVAIAAGASYTFARYMHWSRYDVGWWEAEREIWRGM